MNRPFRAMLAAGLTLAALAAPSAASASAQHVIDVKTTKISYLQYPETGKARAQLRNITVTWRRDRTEKRTWVTVSAQLRDSGPGDGHCARMMLATEVSAFEPFKTAVTTECNGVWRTRMLAMEPGFDDFVTLGLYTSPSADNRTLRSLTNPWGKR
ncbi:hypothetical protein [Microtetraspora malaysiensis]|uniref:hypothetical protein n=1 Tax=Microtetraspora malaysiensis TaxID=161358 RepID=UPI000B13FCC2|nr:hypothetical protein [Microtetraspora malaysiensis]